MHDHESKELLEGLEIAVAVQEHVTFAKAERGDEAVNRLANGSPAGAKVAIVARRSGGELDSAGLEDLEFAEVAQHSGGLVLRREPLEDLAEHEIEKPHRLTLDLSVEPVRLRGRRAVEVVDPDRGVDDDHES
jgi:hypothetical protein